MFTKLIKHNFEEYSFSPWIRLDLSLWDEIIKDTPLTEYTRNSVMFHEQEHLSYVYIIKSGRARITMSSINGEEKHIIICEEGCIIGESSCLIDIPTLTAATAIVNTKAYKIASNVFWDRVFANLKLNKLVMDYISLKSKIFLQQISNLSFAQCDSRVAKALYDLVNQYGIKVDNGYRINIKFTHQDIAHLINSSRVTVSNIFSQFAEDDIITKEEGYTIVIDLEKIINIFNEN